MCAVFLHVFIRSQDSLLTHLSDLVTLTEHLDSFLTLTQTPSHPLSFSISPSL